MKNKLIQTYLKDNGLDKFTMMKDEELYTEISDGHSTMHLAQCFDKVIVVINGEYFNTFEKQRLITGGTGWCVVPRVKECAE